jgi:hypothetical protein
MGFNGTLYEATAASRRALSDERGRNVRILQRSEDINQPIASPDFGRPIPLHYLASNLTCFMIVARGERKIRFPPQIIGTYQRINLSKGGRRTVLTDAELLGATTPCVILHQ